MSTTQQFFASGAGNGFTSCLDRVDVSAYDYWITLGGFKKGDAGNPTTQQIEDSLRWAVKIFWQLRGVKSKVTSTGESSSDALEDVAISDNVFPEQDPVEPFERVCPFAFSGRNETSDELLFLDIIGSSENPACKMYDGVATDESNFVGYGMKTNPWFLAASDAPRLDLALHSFFGGAPTADLSVEYTDMLGPHFVATANASEFWDSKTLDPAGLTATASMIDPESSASVEITALDFYNFA